MFGFNRAERSKLKQLLNKEGARSTRSERPRIESRVIESRGIAVPAPLVPALTIFMVVPDTDISAATYDSGADEWTLGMGEATVLQREGNEEDTQNVDASVPGTTLIKHSDIDTAAELQVRVFNPSRAVLTANQPILVVQDMFGDLYAVQGSSTKMFAVTNETISRGGSGEVERIKRSAGAWVRSGETFDAHDIFMNTGESVDACYIVGIVDYEGLKVIDSIYCNANDWLSGCTS